MTSPTVGSDSRDKPTLRVSCTTVGHSDDKVVRACLYCRAYITVGHPSWIAGVRNKEGEIYRFVTLDGRAQADEFTRLMDDAGFALESHLTSRTTAAMDAVFARAGANAPWAMRSLWSLGLV